jgi:hypothetical protein
MAKSDLLKEAIADARAVKETAIANAKIALEEAFAPRIQSMLSAKLSEQLDDEDDVDDLEMGMDDMGGMDDMMSPKTVGVAVDLDSDGNYDVEGEIGAGADEEFEDMGDEEMGDEEMEAEYDEVDMEEGRYNKSDMNLDEIIAELEAGMYSDDGEEEMEEQVIDSAGDDGDGMIEDEIDSIIESILAEEADDMVVSKIEKANDELTEAYTTIKKLQSVINEVNLLNAKLLYTNKLFRNFELNNVQKMKVIENFDRASNTREVKLVFSTLAESFNRPANKKRVVKESYASKATRTTAPSAKTKHVLTEGNELANRWKKLAGLTK